MLLNRSSSCRQLGDLQSILIQRETYSRKCMHGFPAATGADTQKGRVTARKNYGAFWSQYKLFVHKFPSISSFLFQQANINRALLSIIFCCVGQY